MIPLYNNWLADLKKKISIEGEEEEKMYYFIKCIFFTLGLKLKGFIVFVT